MCAGGGRWQGPSPPGGWPCGHDPPDAWRMDPQGAIGGRRGTQPRRLRAGPRDVHLRAGRSTGWPAGSASTLGLGTTGYNVFAAGAAGAGMLLVLEEELRRRAAIRPAPSDWVYLLDFATPERLAAVALPTGRGPELARDGTTLVEEARAASAPRSSPTPTAGDTETCTSGSTGTVRTRAGGTRRHGARPRADARAHARRRRVLATRRWSSRRPRRARSRAQRPGPHQGLPDPLRAPA